MLENIITSDYLILFITIGFGLILGNVKIGTFSLGSSAVIVVALILGYVYSVIGREIEIPKSIRNIGLIIFIYSIGIQAGPSFVEAIKKDGIKFISLGIMPPVIGGVLIYISWILFPSIDNNLTIGVLTGALTSTPGLAAAQEATGSSLSAVGYGIAYPVGTIGIVLFIKLIPKIFKIDIKKEEEKYNESVLLTSPEIILKKFKIQNDKVIGLTLEKLNLRKKTHCSVSRILKNSTKEVISASADVILEKNDILSVVGTKENIKDIIYLLGEEIDIEFPQSEEYNMKWFIVSEKKALNKPLKMLRLKENFGAGIIRIKRGGIDITPENNTKLRMGDRVKISFKNDRLVGLERFFGDSIKKLNSISFLPISIGVVLGIILGFTPFNIGGTEVKLGITGGVLLVSVFLGHKGKTGSLVWYLPEETTNLLRTLGLLLFLVPVGFSGGLKIKEVLSQYGILIFLIGVVITFISPIICTLIAKYLYKVNMLSFLGILSAGMTSTPALGAVDSMTESNAHKLAYATTYPFALLSIVFVVQILSLLI